MFDWEQFLARYGVDFVTGPRGHVRRDHVGINCPVCGDDSNYHYSIRVTDSNVRGCWRDSSHWMSAVQLISLLSGKSSRDAYDLLHGAASITTSVSFSEVASRLSGLGSAVSDENKTVIFPKEFVSFERQISRRDRFLDYLRNVRGIKSPIRFAEEFDLHFCTSGRWRDRIIIPLPEDDRNAYRGWIGRSIHKDAKSKYMAEPSGDALGNYVFLPGLKVRGKTLFVVEGPFDAMVLDWVARRAKIPARAVAVLTNRLSSDRLAALSRLCSQADGVVVMLDRGERSNSLAISRELATLSPLVFDLPNNVKDPGELHLRGGAEILHDAIGRLQKIS